MNKKAFLAGDTLVYIYSIISLTIIAILFAFLFYSLQAGSFLGLNKEKNLNLSTINSNIDSYDNLNYFLNTKIRAKGKLTSLSELIPLYCYTNDKEIGNYIKNIGINLFPRQLGITIGCSAKKEACPNFVSKYGFLDISKFDKVPILQGSIYSPKIFDIPGLKYPSHYCVEIQNGKHPTDPHKDNFQIERISSDKLFEEKVKAAEARVKEIGLNRPDPEGSTLLLSPAGDLWFFTRADWCNIIEDDCSKYINFKSEDLIKCKGDYLCLKK